MARRSARSPPPSRDDTPRAGSALIGYTELSTHSTAKDCWIALGNEVFDLTRFAAEHPGGSELVTDLAGTDGTAAFLDAHNEDIIKKTLSADEYSKALLGKFDHTTLPAKGPAKGPAPSRAEAPSTVASVGILLQAVVFNLLKSVIAPTAALTLTR